MKFRQFRHQGCFSCKAKNKTNKIRQRRHENYTEYGESVSASGALDPLGTPNPENRSLPPQLYTAVAASGYRVYISQRTVRYKGTA